MLGCYFFKLKRFQRASPKLSKTNCARLNRGSVERVNSGATYRPEMFMFMFMCGLFRFGII